MFRLFVTVSIGLLLSLNAAGMSRTIKKETAVVLAAFGTTTKARATYDFIDQEIRSSSAVKGLPLEWAFTSEIVRERANKAFAKQGSSRRFLSLPQVLANLEAEGYRKVVVQPLHIFPGQEYQEVQLAAQAFRQLGLRIEVGETLLHEWPYVHEVISILENDFLPAARGCNVIVSHGTPQSSHGANATYLGLDRYVSSLYDHVFVGAVEGILTREQALSKARRCKPKSVRFISLMLVSGDHIMNDIMATEPDEDGELSWSLEMKNEGFVTDTLTITVQGKELYQGLGFNKEIVALFTRSIQQSLKKIDTN